MARPIWNGTLAFGLVTLPVGLYTAVAEQTIHFHLVTPDGKCRLRRKLVCPETGKEYDFSDTARGFEVAPDQYVVVEPEELEALKPESGDVLHLDKFVKLEEIDPLIFRKTYWLLPGKKAGEPYALLLRALTETGRVGIGQFIMREKEYLAAVRPSGDSLALHTLYYYDEIRKPEAQSPVELPKKIAQRELKLARQLLEARTEKFKHADYSDEYRTQLSELLKKRAKGKLVRISRKKRAEAETGGKVIDLVARLKESLKAENGGKKTERRKRRAG